MGCIWMNWIGGGVAAFFPKSRQSHNIYFDPITAGVRQDKATCLKM